MIRIILALALLVASLAPAIAQQSTLTFNTVERPPFAFQDKAGVSGFSIDLFTAIAREMDVDVQFMMKPSFSEMLGEVEQGAVDGAIANISITGAREAVMDFTQPIFRSGLQIMVPSMGGEPSIWSAVLNRDLGLAVILALAALLGMGMLMWLFERRKQEFFDRSVGEAMFPAFWYALNLVVNGGFEQNVPRSAMGRLFAVLMVVSSLFIVSFFVANITASMTVQALGNKIENISDLDGRLVGTTADSTASEFLNQRHVSHKTYSDFASLLRAFEAGELEAVFFDGPLLAYYASTDGRGKADLIDRVFRPESYGIALPQGSDLRERMNVALLRLRESGEYDAIYAKWFDGGG